MSGFVPLIFLLQIAHWYYIICMKTANKQYQMEVIKMVVFTQNALKGIPENAILISHFGEIVLCKLVKNKYTPFVV